MTPEPTPEQVLVIDDDLMSREVLTLLLEMEGYAVETVPSGDAALIHLRSRAAPPPIVLTDMQMPGISGVELARALRELCGPDTILLAMSANPAPRGILTVFDGFLLKPFSIAQMVAMLKGLPKRAANRSGSAPVSEAKTSSTPAPQSTSASKPEMNAELQTPPLPAAAIAPDTEPVLNERIYTQLQKTMSTSQMEQMYGMCLKDVRSRIAVMRGLAAQGEADQFARQAHAIKGGCGMLGATELYAIAARLETTGLAATGLEDGPDVNPLDELVAACDRLERILGSRT